jgi:hypothetical protein
VVSVVVVIAVTIVEYGTLLVGGGAGVVVWGVKVVLG